MPNEKSTSHVLNAPTQAPQSATKALKVPKKRGRKGNKIATAFMEVPANPVDFEAYATTHGVQCTVLRQIKRHDCYPELGRVFVRKNKVTKKLMIWREAPKS